METQDNIFNYAALLKQIGWGNNALEQLANDLRNDYPKVKGFSLRNCRCMIQFYKEYDQELTIWQRSVAKLDKTNPALPVKQLGWAHNVILMQKAKDIKARYWYMTQCIKNGWSRDFPVEAIKREITRRSVCYSDRIRTRSWLNMELQDDKES